MQNTQEIERARSGPQLDPDSHEYRAKLVDILADALLSMIIKGANSMSQRDDRTDGDRTNAKR